MYDLLNIDGSVKDFKQIEADILSRINTNFLSTIKSELSFLSDDNLYVGAYGDQTIPQDKPFKILIYFTYGVEGGNERTSKSDIDVYFSLGFEVVSDFAEGRNAFLDLAFAVRKWAHDNFATDKAELESTYNASEKTNHFLYSLRGLVNLGNVF